MKIDNLKDASPLRGDQASEREGLILCDVGRHCMHVHGGGKRVKQNHYGQQRSVLF